MQPGADTDDVDDGVECADLVEVDFFRRRAVNLCFGRGQTGKDGAGAAGDLVGQGGGFEDLRHFGQAALRGLVGYLDMDARGAECSLATRVARRRASSRLAGSGFQLSCGVKPGASRRPRGSRERYHPEIPDGMSR